MTPERLAAIKAYTRLADLGDLAVSELIVEVERMRDALSVCALFLEPNISARYDALAERFWWETGVMAPGKSVPMEMALSQPPDDARAQAYQDWLRDLVAKTHKQVSEALR